MAKSRKVRRARISARRVKQAATYDVSEAARLLGTHRNTIRRWLKGGLAPLDDRRPVLIHGGALKAFLAARKASRRRPCEPGEFYCFRCRSPRKALGGMVDVRVRTPTVLALSALCERCEGPVHRTARRAELPVLARLFDLGPMALERMNGRSEASPDGDEERT